MVNKKTTIILILGMILFSLAYVSATVYNTPISPSTTGNTVTGKAGFNITYASAGYKISNLEKYSGSTATSCYVHEGGHGGSVVATGTFSGHNCALNFDLTSGVTYAILADNGGSSYDATYDNGGSYPVTDGDLTWDIGINQAGLTQSTYSRIFDSITIIASASNIPEVTLNSPTNKQNLTSQTVIFDTTVTDDEKVENVTLYIDGILNQTNTSNQNGTYLFTIPINDGYHNWSILAWDNETQQNLSVTYDFTVDTLAPNITITEKNFTYIETLTNNQILNFTIQDTTNHTCWYDYNATNYTFSCNENGIYLNLTSNNTDIYLWGNDTHGNLAYDYWNWTVQTTPITYNILDYLGALISSVTFAGDITYTGNPYTEFMRTRINNSQKEVNVSLQITDTSYYNQNKNTTININNSYTQYNISLDPNKFVAVFFNETGSTSTSKFALTSNNLVLLNDSSTMVVIQQNLSLGKVNLMFNMDDYIINGSQYYEYDNTLLTHINENLTLIDTPDWTVFFKVKSETGSVIEDATIQAEMGTQSTGTWSIMNLVGQRLTGSDGVTSFIFDQTRFVRVTVTKTGYDTVTRTFLAGDNVGTLAEAVKITMKESDSGISNNLWVGYPKTTINRTTNIHGSIMAKDSTIVKINTNYRVSSGLSPRQLVGTTRDVYNATLVAGTDFGTTTTSDIIVYIYVDNVNVHNWTITHKTPTRIFDLPTTIDDTVLKIEGVIGLIIASSVIGVVFTSTSIGFTTFMVGGILLSLISTKFLWLSLVCAFYFILKLIGRVMKE